MLALHFLGAFFVALHVQPLWAKVLGVFYLFLMSANLTLAAFQQDLRSRDLMRQLPFSPKDIVCGNLVIPTLLLSCLGWVLATLLWARNLYGLEEYALLMAFVPLGTYLVSICGLMNVLAGAHQAFHGRLVVYSAVFSTFGILVGLTWLLINSNVPLLMIWSAIVLIGLFEGAILKRAAVHQISKWMGCHE
jgi:hypothetical protein